MAIQSVEVSQVPVVMTGWQRWRLAMPLALLCLVPLTTVHARTPMNSVDGGSPQAGAVKPAPQKKKKAKVNVVKVRKGLSGTASYYANRFHGRKTASGHPYFKEAMTAAHRSLPLGTWVKVVNQRNGYYTVVQITDRGPYVGNRVIDLSRAAAENLDMVDAGLVPVSLEVVQEYPPRAPEAPEWESSPFGDMRLATGY